MPVYRWLMNSVYNLWMCQDAVARVVVAIAIARIISVCIPVNSSSEFGHDVSGRSVPKEFLLLVLKEHPSASYENPSCAEVHLLH